MVMDTQLISECKVGIFQCGKCDMHYALDTLHYALSSVQCALCNVLCEVYSVRAFCSQLVAQFTTPPLCLG